ncbi:hypothetical protein LOZ58_006104 [Ophidiomyces ophidiicola]|nr:hypothetical protein LOZ65_003540 [Ophidiomyces ophidiicola]KAI1943082.1 hypothetical protein LOZ66_000777 [Ophidiomyces ophidiicola]KAI1956792.1 hypothetical protein LOZ58_006104 [Ophidiomyces ophidiicola]
MSKNTAATGTGLYPLDNKIAPPVNYAMVLYPGFQALDAFGPLDVLNSLASTENINLFILAPTLEPVSTTPLPRPGLTWNKGCCSQSVVPTHTYDNLPESIDVLLVPGGTGNRDDRIREPVSKLIHDLYPKLKYLFTICTGSKLPAHVGILDGRNATSNKLALKETISLYPKVNWIGRARWVVDGNIWTSSGVTAGMDGLLALVEHIYDAQKADNIAYYLEYAREKDSSNDPFYEE